MLTGRQAHYLDAVLESPWYRSSSGEASAISMNLDRKRIAHMLRCMAQAGGVIGRVPFHVCVILPSRLSGVDDAGFYTFGDLPFDISSRITPHRSTSLTSCLLSMMLPDELSCLGLQTQTGSANGHDSGLA
jgi:hypothetical protein